MESRKCEVENSNAMAVFYHAVRRGARRGTGAPAAKWRDESGCPSIRAKALSRRSGPLQCFFHRVVAREVEDRNSGNLTVNHFSVKSFHQPSIRPALRP